MAASAEGRGVMEFPGGGRSRIEARVQHEEMRIKMQMVRGRVGAGKAKVKSCINLFKFLIAPALVWLFCVLVPGSSSSVYRLRPLRGIILYFLHGVGMP